MFERRFAAYARPLVVRPHSSLKGKRNNVRSYLGQVRRKEKSHHLSFFLSLSPTNISNSVRIRTFVHKSLLYLRYTGKVRIVRMWKEKERV